MKNYKTMPYETIMTEAPETRQEAKAIRIRLLEISRREYTTRGNTEKCQKIWKRVEAIDALPL